MSNATPASTMVRVDRDLVRDLKVRAAETGSTVKALVEQGALIVLSQPTNARNDRAAS